ncbi:hypothetical protein VCRLGP8_840013 [Vibrio crassostreae]|nr:hypothetical protein VCRLGP7_630136 [Vibrio crassostreae]CDT44237.1 hypothetical protein VCRLGP107_610019 [Vibrio crassostreae]CDT74280.1 hypothetical protein VCRLGP8_840013 [Vibrio crassostreae]
MFTISSNLYVTVRSMFALRQLVALFTSIPTLVTNYQQRVQICVFSILLLSFILVLRTDNNNNST